MNFDRLGWFHNVGSAVSGDTFVFHINYEVMEEGELPSNWRSQFLTEEHSVTAGGNVIRFRITEIQNLVDSRQYRIRCAIIGWGHGGATTDNYENCSFTGVHFSAPVRVYNSVFSNCHFEQGIIDPSGVVASIPPLESLTPKTKPCPDPVIRRKRMLTIDG